MSNRFHQLNLKEMQNTHLIPTHDVPSYEIGIARPFLVKVKSSDDKGFPVTTYRTLTVFAQSFTEARNKVVQKGFLLA